MQGVVPAAGEGTRLRPLTDGRPKALVEVGGRPLLAHCFDTLVELGVDELVAVVGQGGEQIRRRFDDAFDGIPVRYAEQPEPRGLADAVLEAEPFVHGDFVVLNGDNVVDADLSPLVQRHRAMAAAATLLVEEVSPDRAAEGGVLCFDDDGQLAGLVEKPNDPPSRWVTRGCHAFSPRLFAACRRLRPAATGEFELTAAVERLVEAGARVETVPLDGRCVNVNVPADLARAERILQG